MANQTPTHTPNSSPLWDERTVNNSMGNMTNQTPTTHPHMQEGKKPINNSLGELIQGL